MPDLEVCIIGVNMPWPDLSPISNCKKLEYLEMEDTSCRDISALKGLTNLKHLNIVGLGEITGYESLLTLDSIERLWIGGSTKVPQEIVDEIQALHPDCEINTTALAAIKGHWQVEPNGGYVPRYALLRQQFEYSDYGHSCSSIKNDKRYYSYDLQ